jgi:hypothetical protein
MSTCRKEKYYPSETAIRYLKEKNYAYHFVKITRNFSVASL